MVLFDNIFGIYFWQSRQFLKILNKAFLNIIFVGSMIFLGVKTYAEYENVI